MSSFKVMSLSVMRLEFAPGIWRGLMDDLCKRSSGVRESGAFLVASRSEETVNGWIPYDELSAASLGRAFVRLESAAFTKLWKICAERSLKVVADVHTHPAGAKQSATDRSNPMIARQGHVALVVPNYAAGEPMPASVSFNVYMGSGHWRSYLGEEAAMQIVIS